MKKVYCLYRVSSKQQSEQGKIPMQQSQCRQFARDMGWEVAKEFHEVDVSGYHAPLEKRDALYEIIDAAASHRFDILLVFMIDRIGRQTYPVYAYIAMLLEIGIEVWSVVEGRQATENHLDKLITYVRAWQAEGESKKISERVQTAMCLLVEQNTRCSGRAPFGYKLMLSGNLNKRGHNKKEICIHPSTSECIKQIFILYVYNLMGCDSISKYLNEQNILTDSGKPWTPASVRYVLHNPIYTGRLNRGKLDRPIEDLRLVPDELFHEAQRRFECQKQKYQKSDSSLIQCKFSFPLYCEKCGGKLRLITSQRKYKTKNGEEKIYRKEYYACKNNGSEKHKCRFDVSLINEKILQEITDCLSTAAGLSYDNLSFHSLNEEYSDCHRNIRLSEQSVSSLRGQIDNIESQFMKMILDKEVDENVSSQEKQWNNLKGRLDVEERNLLSLKDELVRIRRRNQVLQKQVEVLLNTLHEYAENTLYAECLDLMGIVTSVSVEQSGEVRVVFQKHVKVLLDNIPGFLN